MEEKLCVPMELKAGMRMAVSISKRMTGTAEVYGTV